MKKELLIILLLGFAFINQGKSQTDNCNPDYSNNSGATIDNPNPLVIQDVVISGTGLTVSNLTVSLQLDHNYGGDINIFLLHQETQTQVDLLGGNGLGGNCLSPVFYNVTLTDKSSQSFNDACGEVTGEYQPVGALAAFDDLAFDGTWTLTIVDNYPGFDTGNLTGWCINTDGAGVTNEPPTAQNDTVSGQVNTVISFYPLLNDADSDGTLDISTLTVTTDPTEGTTEIVNDTINYTGNSFVGIDSLEYEICDNGGACAKAWVFVEIIQGQVNQAPVVVDDEISAQSELKVLANVLSNDSDPDGELVSSTLEILVQPNNGTAAIENSQIAYTSNAGYEGMDTVKYKVCDNGDPTQCGEAFLYVNVVVELENTSPAASNDEFTVADTVTLLNVLSNDVDAESNIDASSVTVIDAPTLGTTQVMEDGSIEYTTEAGTNGTDSFTYEVCDQGAPALCDTAAVNLTVDVTLSSIIENSILPLQIGPNPVNNILTISALDADGELTIMGVTGKVMTTIQIVNQDQIKVDFSEFSQGIYFISLKGKNGNFYSNKVIKQ